MWPEPASVRFEISPETMIVEGIFRLMAKRIRSVSSVTVRTSGPTGGFSGVAGAAESGDSSPKISWYIASSVLPDFRFL